MQEFILVSLFVVSILYLVREFKKAFSTKNGDSCKGCSSCNTAELNKVAAQLQEQQEKQSLEKTLS